ncbi:MAG: 3-phosphoshikimate 1-carboxyvinyltransferase [Candidatus Desulforudis sp.]|nr:3-phosphoshikimate 1-carboxyvinyltransferase [Desulforudis sp.]
MSDQTRLKITPTRGLRGEISVPGDKSISHRAVMLGALAQGETVATNFLSGEDCLATIRCFQALGVEIDGPRDDNVRIRGRGLFALQEPEDVLDTGNSGTTMRLLLGILAGQPFFSVVTGDASLRRRPMGRVTQPLLQMGAVCMGRDGANYAPIAVSGGRLRAISHQLPVASAQLKSALLLAGLFADERTIISEPIPTRDHTERMLAAFGASLSREGRTVGVDPAPQLQGREITVPGDISSAAFLIVGALITPDSDLLVRGVGVNPTRTGVLDALSRMGARITVRDFRDSGGEPVADIRVQSSMLQGTVIDGPLIPRLIDEIPILTVAAVFARGETVFRDATELRVKESDRLSAIRMELNRLGADIHETPDGLLIRGTGRLAGGTCRSHGDHRIAMAAAIAGLGAARETCIEDASCTSVSFPAFTGALNSLRLE